ncbi:[histone H3]-lysine4 N-trimethyltransferase ASH1L [Emericellopsis cladophorae]|uniref:[histone H3]-lysine4 N-trimethyltransferase ASH1L n=1 Tax=Emericellopsis cladophorae TaxID=2686198 RepID=A0A9P9XUJ8_9HYPO|nr:[histone H3]-lysine4 N-trimethyltransferase ASH1L [Emericellopsis cladophorae]KAI6777985.1 [histone H3]-lysine4 N-trimethyltransferase ASH1L [Emericellopsis cladophorae]
MSLSPERSFSAAPLDALSNIASSNSTPPTTVADSASLHSDTSKHDMTSVADLAADSPDSAQMGPLIEQQLRDEAIHRAEAATPERSRRVRDGKKPVYNIAQLIGTAGHGKRRAKGDSVSNRRRRTIGRATDIDQEDPDTIKGGTPTRRTRRSLGSTTTKTHTEASPRPKRVAARQPTPAASRQATPVVADRPGVSTRRSRRSGDVNEKDIPRELRRLEDTKEFSHVDDSPVVYTVWSNGKYVDPNQVKKEEERKKAKQAVEELKVEEEPVTQGKKRRVKKYLDKGLYAGQDAPKDPLKGLTPGEKKQLDDLPELRPGGVVNKVMPLPMFTGLRTLIAGRDFKLPFNICNPLPPGQPKPDEWRKMTKNRFIGESKDIWRKSDHFHDYQSKCVCKATDDDPCGESCQNRIMLYECDETNCNVGPELCRNRAFRDLTKRRNKGGKYRVGVEVVKTSDRGYGVRANRGFAPGQIIMEYAGEIITEEECDRRMNEVYKDNECYYLMSFDQNMIIDATSGSIARFVNHSCNPNCRMIKWIVSGQPRMALFAGDNPIYTGDELTYDYNFDPFSAKNVQLCLCGEEKCRGVLGPKTRHEAVQQPGMVKATAGGGKRKLGAALSGKADGRDAKKPRITSTKGALASVGLKISHGTATAIKKGVSAVKKATALGGKASAAKSRGKGQAVVKKTSTSRVVKAYVKTGPARKRVSTTTKVKGKAGSGVLKTKTIRKTVTAEARARATKGPKNAAAKKRKEAALDKTYDIASL